MVAADVKVRKRRTLGPSEASEQIFLPSSELGAFVQRHVKNPICPRVIHALLALRRFSVVVSAL